MKLKLKVNSVKRWAQLTRNSRVKEWSCELVCEDDSTMYVSVSSMNKPTQEEIELFVLSLAYYPKDYDTANDMMLDVMDFDSSEDVADMLFDNTCDWDNAKDFEVIIGKKLVASLKKKHNW